MINIRAQLRGREAASWALAQTVGKACMYLSWSVTQCMTMELRAMVIFFSALLEATPPAHAICKYIVPFYCRRAENEAELNWNILFQCTWSVWDWPRSALRSKALPSVILFECSTGVAMHDHGTESRGHVLFRVTRGDTSGTCIETRFNLFQSVSSQQTLTIGTLYH